MNASSVIALVEEWIGRLGAPVDATRLEEWFAEWDAGDLTRGRARDARVGLLQIDASGGVLSRVYLDLATPSAVGVLEERYGPGQCSYAADATYETVTWTTRRGTDDVLVTADCAPDGRLVRITLLQVATVGEL